MIDISMKYNSRSIMMDQLKYDILKNNNIKKKTSSYIKHLNIHIHNFKKKANLIIEDDLPYQTILGSSYLIKNNIIIKIYCWCDISYSLNIMVSHNKPVYKGKIYIVNNDVSDSENLEFILDNDSSYYEIDTIQYTIITLLNMGFSLYI